MTLAAGTRLGAYEMLAPLGASLWGRLLLPEETRCRERIPDVTSHPRFTSLAQAVRAGMHLVPDAAPPRRYFGVSAESGRLGCDALAAAWFAEYYDTDRSAEDEDRGLSRFLSIRLTAAYPVLNQDQGPECPAGPRDRCPMPSRPGRTLEAKIIHLQDEHGVSREKVADWLQAHGY